MIRPTLLLLILALIITPLVGASSASPSAVLDMPVIFTVSNANRSQVACDSDGRTYQIRGRLISPQNMPDSVVVWMHGATVDGWQWHFTAVPGYDFAGELALSGHASLVFDELGHGASGRPDGFDVCIGSHADIVHQIIQDLRRGNYIADGRSGPVFARVGLGGNSLGSMIAEAEAVSFDDAVALIITGWADPPVTGIVKINEVFPNVAASCAQGGEPADGPNSGSPSGYTTVWPSADAEADDAFYNVDPRVADVFKGSLKREPCGVVTSIGAAVIAINAGLATIDHPVLLVYGDHDLVSPVEAAIQSTRYVSSPDVNLAIIPRTGHVGMVERTARSFRSEISAWLTSHRL